MTRRERLRQNTIAEIKAHARRQMTENGTAAVSLSAIARAMEISAPALYRYYASRDELVTALIVDAFDDLAATLEAVSASLPEHEYGQRLYRVVLAYRQWAVEHPIDFELIYGNPIPGYHAPEQITTPPARRGFTAILRILAAAHQAGQLRPPPEYLALPAEIGFTLAPLENDDSHQLPALVIYIGMAGWYHIHGLIMLEIFHHSSHLVNDPALFYRHELAMLLRSVGLAIE